MKLAAVLPADTPPAAHLAAYYVAQTDGRWILQIDQQTDQHTAPAAADNAPGNAAATQLPDDGRKMVATELTAEPVTNPGPAPEAGGRLEAGGHINHPVMTSGGGAGQVDDLTPASIAANDSDAINQNLSAIASGRMVLSGSV